MQTKDIKEIVSVERETLSPWSAASIRDELKIPRGIQLVAENSAEAVIGWCGCRVVSPEAELLKIAVKERTRRGGVANRLLDALLGKLQQGNITVLFLEVRSRNFAAKRFYERRGFLRVGLRSAYYSNPLDDAVIYRKTIK